MPWRPADLEQRAGRIIRQGNENKDKGGVYIYRYITENTLMPTFGKPIENKQKFISQIMTSKTPVRVAEDVDEKFFELCRNLRLWLQEIPKSKRKWTWINEVTKLKNVRSKL